MSDGLFVVVGEAFGDGFEDFFHHPVRFAEGDDEVFAPEDFHFFDAYEFVAFVEIGEVEDKEVVVVVFVDFGTLVGAAAVLDVERVEVVGVEQEAVVVFGCIGNVMPFKVLVLSSFYHNALSYVFGGWCLCCILHSFKKFVQRYDFFRKRANFLWKMLMDSEFWLRLVLCLLWFAVVTGSCFGFINKMLKTNACRSGLSNDK